MIQHIEIGELNSLAYIYGIKNDDAAKQFLNTIVDVGTVGAAAKAAISTLKGIPGINLGASVLNAIIAGSIVAALGEGAFFFWCQGIWHGQMPPAAAGFPFRFALHSNVVGTCGSPTNAPSLFLATRSAKSH